MERITVKFCVIILLRAITRLKCIQTENWVVKIQISNVPRACVEILLYKFAELFCWPHLVEHRLLLRYHFDGRQIDH